jgi:hypothetical protein
MRIVVAAVLTLLAWAQAGYARATDASPAVAVAVQHFRSAFGPDVVMELDGVPMELPEGAVPMAEMGKRLGVPVVNRERRCEGHRAYIPNESKYIFRILILRMSDNSAKVMVVWSHNDLGGTGPQLVYHAVTVEVAKSGGKWSAIGHGKKDFLHYSDSVCED